MSSLTFSSFPFYLNEHSVYASNCDNSTNQRKHITLMECLPIALNVYYEKILIGTFEVL